MIYSSFLYKIHTYFNKIYHLINIMSLLSDILTKVKPSDRKGNVPPGLITMVSNPQGKKVHSKRSRLIICCGAPLLITVGIFLFYFTFTPPTETTNQNAANTEQPYEIIEVAHAEIQRPDNLLENKTAIQTDEANGLSAEKRTEDKRSHHSVVTTPSPPDNSHVKTHSGNNPENVSVVNPLPKQTPYDDLSYNNVLSDQRKPIDYYLYSGDACEKKGDYAEALTWYKKALTGQIQDYKLLNKMGYVLIALSLYDEAETYLLKALKVKSDCIPALNNMGIICSKRKDYSGAEKYLLEALSHDEINQNTLYNLMLLFKKQGKHKLASKYHAKLQAVGFPSK